MATVSNAGGGSSMSNAQAGTRGLSGGDWTRILKLRAHGKASWNNDGDGVSTNKILYSQAMLIPKTTGSSRIRNTASDWTNWTAFKRLDYVTQTQAIAPDGTILNGKTLTTRNICTCSTSSPNKEGICQVCSVGRWYRRRI